MEMEFKQRDLMSFATYIANEVRSGRKQAGPDGNVVVTEADFNNWYAAYAKEMEEMIPVVKADLYALHDKANMYDEAKAEAHKISPDGVVIVREGGGSINAADAGVLSLLHKIW